MKKILIISFVQCFFLCVTFAQYESTCFTLKTESDAFPVQIKKVFTADTTIMLDVKTSISGLVISGNAQLRNENSYIRVLLRDNYNYDYLVYENYLLLSDSEKVCFDKTGIETISLENIIPQCLIIELKESTLSIDNINCTPTKKTGNHLYDTKKQNQYIVDKLNKNIKQHNGTWTASVTPMSMKSYEDKKSLFGGTVPLLYGFEYYAGGVFVIPGSQNLCHENVATLNNTSNQYVLEWDWRNRHGKDWLTTVKNQGGCGSCGAFSAVGALEAYTNLYYNRLINYDLAEQELISCINGFKCSGDGAGMTQGTAFNYIKNNGIRLESCFPYTAVVQDCEDKCENPSEIVTIEDYHNFYYTHGEEFIKQKLFISPIPFGIHSWNHAVVLAGYKTIEINDTIYTGSHNYVIINENEHYNMIGKTAWLIKNSWGTDWGNDGYAYVITELSNLAWLYYITGSISSMLLSDEDVECVDSDGDGYYFWGIGRKPDSCPSWVPDVPDGDDSDYTLGALDSFGYTENLALSEYNYEYINDYTEYTIPKFVYSNIVITTGSVLSISNMISLYPLCKIIIEPGGELIINGGILNNANIQMSSSSKLTMINNGVINLRSNCNFDVPLGAVVNVSAGIIQ